MIVLPWMLLPTGSIASRVPQRALFHTFTLATDIQQIVSDGVSERQWDGALCAVWALERMARSELDQCEVR